MAERLSRDFLFPVELEEEVEPPWGLMGQPTDGIIGAVEGLGCERKSTRSLIRVFATFFKLEMGVSQCKSQVKQKSVIY